MSKPASSALLRSNTRSIWPRSEEHTSELQSRQYLVWRLLLEKKKEPSRRYPASVPHQGSVNQRSECRPRGYPTTADPKASAAAGSEHSSRDRDSARSTPRTREGVVIGTRRCWDAVLCHIVR